MTSEAHQLIDTETTTMLLDALEEDFYETIDEFIEVGFDLSNKITRLTNDLSDNPDELLRTVHTLKGASGNIGAALLCTRCQNMESQLHNGDYNNLNPLAAEIADIFQQTKQMFIQQFRQES